MCMLKLQRYTSEAVWLLFQYSVPATDTTYYCSIHYLPYLIYDVDTLSDPIYLYKVRSPITYINAG